MNLSRNWVMIPAVTYHEDADITDLEAFRVQLNKENEKSGNKLTMLAFLIKACVKAMQRYPEFNASLDGDNLVLKKYFNIGFAALTAALRRRGLWATSTTAAPSMWLEC